MRSRHAEGEIPSTGTILRRLRLKFKCGLAGNQAVEEFMAAQDRLITWVKRRRLLTHKATAKVDVTDGWEFWGKKNPAIASLEHKRRTPWGFKYLYLSIRVGKIEIVVGVLPLWPLSDKAKRLDDLLDMVERKGMRIRGIKLGRMLMDRGFE